MTSLNDQQDDPLDWRVQEMTEAVKELKIQTQRVLEIYLGESLFQVSSGHNKFKFHHGLALENINT